MRKIVLFGVVAASALMAGSDIESLKKQLDTQQKMIEELQKKIAQMELQRKEEMAAETKAKPKKEITAAAFVPDISLILDTSVVGRNISDDKYGHLELPGIAHAHHEHEGHAHAPMNAERGFNLNYAELAMRSSVDPYFDIDGVFHLSEGNFEIEEAYITTTSLPLNLRARAGKFLSEFGRLNNQHHHVWNFADQPLVYSAFLGDHGLNEKGVQLQWVAPTPTYWMFGVEALQGKNENSYGTSSLAPADAEEDFAGTVKKAYQPNLVVAYTKTSFDMGDTTLLAGLSWATGEARINHLEDENPHAFAGDVDLYGADLTFKHFFDSYRSLTWQSEYLYRKMDGTKYAPAGDDWNANATGSMEKKQAGFYSELVYQLDRNWRTGVRYDKIFKNDIIFKGSSLPFEDDFRKYAVMLEYNPSEFSRLRLQYNRDESRFNENNEREKINEIILQFNMTIGAHGAHPF